MHPILLTPSGELPNGLTMERVQALGLTPVHPTPMPQPDPGYTVEEAAPELVDGIHHQRWVQVPIEQPQPEPLEDLKAEAIRCIDQLHAEALLFLTGDPTQAEQTTWAGKVALAEAIHSGAPLSLSHQAFLASNGITPDRYAQYAKTVLTKSARYWAVVGMADRVRSDCKGRVARAQTHEQLAQASAENTAQHSQTLADAATRDSQ